MSTSKKQTPGRVLIADDEETFLHSTADLLRREGYHCDTAPDASTAADMLSQNEYDVLIADIKMPGNPNLELIESIPSIARGLPAILVTGYPSLESAIQSIQLPVAAYMLKPLDFDELLLHVQVAISRYRVLTTVNRVQKRLSDWQTDLDKTEKFMRQSASGLSPIPVDLFLDLTLSNIVASLSDLRNLTESQLTHKHPSQVCHLLGCPRPPTFIKALREVISVLKKTKSAFKSKELAQLREKIEAMVEDMEQAPQGPPGQTQRDTGRANS